MRNTKTKYITVDKTARFETYGKLNTKTKYFWFVIHGSNMRCEQMVYKFSDFDPDTHFVVAPEGLSRHYEKGGFRGDVLATWMTSRDRLEEIKDFSNYLTKLYQLYINQLDSACKKIILAFSQGGTTAYRWLHHSAIKADYFIPYSCWIPEDIDLTESKTELNTIQTYYTVGNQDQFLTEERLSALEDIIQKNELLITKETYDGDHRVNRQQVKKLFEKYIVS